MKKIILLLACIVMITSTGLTGCSSDTKTSGSKSSTDISECKLEDFVLSSNGTVLTFPFKISDLYSTLDVYSDNKEDLNKKTNKYEYRIKYNANKGSLVLVHLKAKPFSQNDSSDIIVDYKNLGNEDVTMLDCSAVKVELHEKDGVFKVAKGIKVGTSTYDEIVKHFGEPTKKDMIGTSINSATYTFDKGEYLFAFGGAYGKGVVTTIIIKYNTK